MTDSVLSTSDLTGKRVIGGKKNKRLGKVHFFVFHPTEKRCLGFTVRRPDAALMFKRKDLFVTLGGYTVEDGEVVLSNEPSASGAQACKALGVDYDSCIIWEGMPVTTVSGDMLGYVGAVSFDAQTGKVKSITCEKGAASEALLGKLVIPSKLVGGFRLGQGVALARMGSYDGAEDDENTVRGSIVVADEAAEIGTEGGIAAAAGKATAKATDKAKKGAAKAKAQAGKATEHVKPVAKKAGEAAERGVFAAGKQLGRASGMFAAFKEEFDKASRDDD